MQKRLEKLINRESLVSGMDYNEKSKDSFFYAVENWSRQLGNSLNIEIWSPARCMKFSLSHAYESILKPNKNHSFFKQVYSVAAPLINLPMIPFFGAWAYFPKIRTIIRGNDFQRQAISIIQADLLVHEYLHAYEHNLHDYLLGRNLIKEQPNPASIVEPRLWGFIFYPPSKNFLSSFEKKILRRIK